MKMYLKSKQLSSKLDYYIIHMGCTKRCWMMPMKSFKSTEIWHGTKFAIYLPTYLFTYLPIYLPTYLPIYLLIYL